MENYTNGIFIPLKNIDNINYLSYQNKLNNTNKEVNKAKTKVKNTYNNINNRNTYRIETTINYEQMEKLKQIKIETGMTQRDILREAFQNWLNRFDRLNGFDND